MTFQALKLIPQLLSAVDSLGYREPTPIQRAAIGPILEGRDLIGCAQTGTGKTAAFVLPLLQLLQRRAMGGNRPIRALILTPTRELALQIDENIGQYGKKLPLRHLVIFGGVGQNPQVEGLRRGVDILTATPGRLNDLCNQGHIDLSRVEFFVLDEADRMLDMGFIHDVRKVIARLPSDRQTLLFSATMPQEIEELSRTILRKPVRVAVTPVASTADAIEQRLYKVDKGNKKHLLLHLLQDRDLRSVLVFTNTKHRANQLAKELTARGVVAAAIHGNKSQSARVAALEQFKAGSIRVLVATDIAARGIDVSELSCVVNYELPNVPETYVHRIGRTGRAGRGGVAVSFCNVDELPCLKDIEALIGKKIPEVSGHPWPMEILEPTPKQARAPRPARPDRGVPKSKTASKQPGSSGAKQSELSSSKQAGPSGAKHTRAASPRQADPSGAKHTRAASPPQADPSCAKHTRAASPPQADPSGAKQPGATSSQKTAKPSGLSKAAAKQPEMSKTRQSAKPSSQARPPAVKQAAAESGRTARSRSWNRLPAPPMLSPESQGIKTLPQPWRIQTVAAPKPPAQQSKASPQPTSAARAPAAQASTARRRNRRRSRPQ